MIIGNRYAIYKAVYLKKNTENIMFHFTKSELKGFGRNWSETV